jgi:hypothetical protein
MFNNYWSPQVDKQELIKLAGEQTLLQHDRNALAAIAERDRRSVVGLANDLHNASQPQWLEASTQLLTRVHANKVELDRLDAQIADLRKLTGL